MTIISKSIHKAVQFLVQEKVIGFPTETVYGLAGNAFSQKATDAIFRIKNRPKTNPLILHIPYTDDLTKYAHINNDVFFKLADKFWPGPITFLLDKKSLIPDSITAGKKTVAIRIPNHSMALQVLRNITFPLAAPSANPFKYISPTSAQHVKKILNNKLEFILNGGKCQKGIESTIIGIEENTLVIYRPGAISIEEIKKVYSNTKIYSELNTIITPGMFKKHYSPQTPLIACSDVNRELPMHINKKIGVITYTPRKLIYTPYKYLYLSKNADFYEAAHNLYNYFFKLDAMNLDLIMVEFLPNRELGVSINDRIKKAANS